MLSTALSALLALALLALDQWVKRYITLTLPLGESRPLLPGFLELKAVHNYGAAWSSFSGQRWLLVIATSCIVLVLLFLLVRRVVRHPLGVLACCLIVSGGVGNILDRARLGYVVDMFNFQFMNYPVFNVADICIVSGCVLGFIYYQWFYEKYDKCEKKEKPHGNADTPSRGT
ncbi:MAG: signal peptidase II [Oscillibacter sp.]|nr:signal peptidase II [Oscillibacter sp.]